jgi:hypothetical protein
MKISRHFAPAIVCALLLLAAGCSVSVDKAKNGEDQNVKIDTPLGGLHVKSDDTSAADIGLPVYPGAIIASKNHGDKAVDIRMGFGEWQLRIKVVKYQSSDSADKILAFYKKGLGRYGNVIQCDGQTAVGTPTITTEGLGCADSQDHHEVNIDGERSLRAGSKRHQHIMAIEKNSGVGTTFSLVELDLPAAVNDSKQETN